MHQDGTWYGGRPRPDDIVLDGDPAPPPQKEGGAASPIFGACLLWPNGWMDEDVTRYGSRPRPRPHCVRGRDTPSEIGRLSRQDEQDGDAAPREGGTTATAELLLYFGTVWRYAKFHRVWRERICGPWAILRSINALNINNNNNLFACMNSSQRPSYCLSI